MIYLDLEDLVHIAERILHQVELRDIGLLEASLARPQASAFGKDAYPSLHAKAAALLHSIVRNHALVDGKQAARARCGDRVLRHERLPADAHQ